MITSEELAEAVAIGECEECTVIDASTRMCVLIERIAVRVWDEKRIAWTEAHPILHMTVNPDGTRGNKPKPPPLSESVAEARLKCIGLHDVNDVDRLIAAVRTESMADWNKLADERDTLRQRVRELEQLNGGYVARIAALESRPQPAEEPFGPRKRVRRKDNGITGVVSDMVPVVYSTARIPHLVRRDDLEPAPAADEAKSDEGSGGGK